MNQPSEHPNKFAFADFTLDLDRGALLSAGAEIRLRPKSFEVLRFLVEHHGHLVSQQEMLDEIWGDAIVTEDSLRQCIIEIRRALGDKDQQIVRNVPRRGYLFDLPVHAADDAGTAAGQPRDAHRIAAWRIGAGLALALLAAGTMWWLTRPGDEGPGPAVETPPPHSIAVLRLDDMSPAGDQAYLCEGIAEEIIHRLTQSPSLRVIARTSSFAVSGDTIPEIAKQLDVAYVLEGSLRRSGNEIRVTAQLVDAATDAHLFSVTYDRNLDDILLVQAEIAGKVADTLNVTFSGTVAADVADAHAYELYLQGRYFYLRRASGDMEKARDYFTQALDIDPEFARAWAGVAAVANLRLNDKTYYQADPGQRSASRETQRHAVEQALKYGPELPEAHVRAAAYYWQTGDKARSLEHMEIARKLDPVNWLVGSMQAANFLYMRRLAEAIEVDEKSVRRDPLNATLRTNLADALLYAGRREDARAQFATVMELYPSLQGTGRLLPGYAHTLILLGQPDEALELIRAAPAGNRRLQGLALAYHALGREADADQALNELTDHVEHSWDLLAVAEVYAYRGDAGQALAWLDRLRPALQCEPASPLVETYYSPLLATLEDDAGWQEWRAETAQQMTQCAW